ncbi:hypothetical protein [Microbacterium sp.]|uniref:hypothetical protein n=1 Tax=Microbacterium sp. TaxID=51671 RepID=UPI0039E685F4
MTDDAEKLYGLGDELNREARLLADASRGVGPQTAEDPSGTIRVTRGEDGTPSFAINEGWRSSYRPSELAAAVIQTLARLADVETEVWSERLEEGLGENRGSIPTPPVSGSAAARLQAALEAEPDRGAALTRTLENVLSMLDDMTANIDETFKVAVQRGNTTYSSASLARNVVVEVTVGGDLIDVSFSESWLSRSSGAQITRELNEAIADARGSAAAVLGQKPFEGTPLAKYQRFLDDPDSFIDEIRGRG